MTRRLRAVPPAALPALLALLAAGCAVPPPAPPFERPAAPVAPAFPAAGAADAAGTAAADIPWPQFFTDERLRALIGLALQDNRDLRLAALAVEQARAQLALRQADTWPTVNAGASASRAPNGRGDVNTLYQAGVQVTAWELDLFGRLRSLDEAAAAQLAASEEARRAVQISLVAAVAATHLALQGDEALLGLARATVESRQASLELIRLRVDHGAASSLDLAQAESLAAAARVAVQQALRQRAADENTLVALVGRPLPADLPPTQPLEAAAALPGLPAGLPAEVLARRPDVRQAEQQLRAAHAGIGAARAAFFPRITLTGSLGFASTELGSLFAGGSFGWSLAPQLLQPIFDAGRNAAAYRSAQLAREAAVAQYERALQAAFREVADALAGRATLTAQRDAQRDQVRAEQDRRERVELRYRHGASSHLELLDAERSLFAARQALVQAEVATSLNAVALYRVLGGGWQAMP